MPEGAPSAGEREQALGIHAGIGRKSVENAAVADREDLEHRRRGIEDAPHESCEVVALVRRPVGRTGAVHEFAEHVDPQQFRGQREAHARGPGSEPPIIQHFLDERERLGHGSRRGGHTIASIVVHDVGGAGRERDRLPREPQSSAEQHVLPLRERPAEPQLADEISAQKAQRGAAVRQPIQHAVQSVASADANRGRRDDRVANSTAHDAREDGGRAGLPSAGEPGDDGARLELVVGAHDREPLGLGRVEPGVERPGGRADAVAVLDEPESGILHHLAQAIGDGGHVEIVADDRDPHLVARAVENGAHRPSDRPLDAVDGDDQIDGGMLARSGHALDLIDSGLVRILSVVGARPQFVKLAPIARAAAEAGVEHVIVHTGQHYDPIMSDVFFDDLGIPAPDVHLGIGSGSHGHQTGAMMGPLEDAFLAQQPDWVLVYGDTNSTLAAAVAAVKIHVPLAHLEAGLRSFNRRMPEEHNRVLTDHAADLCLAPTEQAMRHLAREGLAERSVLVGDVMTDVLFQVRDAALDRGVAPITHAPGTYSVATIHRAETTDDRERLATVLDALRSLDHPVVLLAHPRLVARAAEFGLALDGGSLESRTPLAYPDLVAAVQSSRGVVTDSGGLQKEAFLLRVPCTTVRTETEWVETVALGWNVLALTGDEIRSAAQRPMPAATSEAPYGDGFAAGRVIEALRG